MKTLLPILAIVVGACGGDKSPTAPSGSANISGTWRGTATSSVVAGNVNTTATLTQTGASVSGTYACSPGTLGCLHASGSVTGTMSGNSLTAQLAFPDGHSCGGFNGTLSGNTLSGNYSCTDPVGNDQGSWTMTKQ